MLYLLASPELAVPAPGRLFVPRCQFHLQRKRERERERRESRETSEIPGSGDERSNFPVMQCDEVSFAELLSD